MAGRSGRLPYLLGRVLRALSEILGAAAGCLLWLVLLARLPPFETFAKTALFGGLAVSGALGAWLCSSWAYVVDVRCPFCGGAARFRPQEGFFGRRYYACADCGRRWRPGKGDGFNG